MYDIIVIGGGAAGMLAATTAAQRKANVLLLEGNKQLGKKLSITGKGRCNLTNNCSVSEALDNIPTGNQFLHSAMNAFAPADCIAFFESLGVQLKTERGNRVFPISDKASDVVNALIKHVKECGVAIKHTKATDIMAKNGEVFAVETANGQLPCKTVILASGGLSYPATGSTGDGYSFSRSLGHTITPLKGSLVPIEAEPAICSAMQGLTLKNVALKIFSNSQKLIYSDFGEILFTHFGLSGPMALSASAHLRDFYKEKYHAFLDFKPALDEKTLDMRILRDFEKYANRDFLNALGDLLSRASIPIIINKSGIDPHTKVHSISREQRMGLVRLLKAFRIDITGLRPVEEAVITSGGVDLREINPKTMESKLVKGLYFAGEIIDADAYTGGFNLQIAWSTGFAAGAAASASVSRIGD